MIDKDIMLYIILVVNFLLLIIAICGTRKYKKIFFRMGIVIYKNSFDLKRDYFISDSEKIVEKEEAHIKISKNELLFNSDSKYILLYRFFPLWPIFGEGYITGKTVTIKYKLSIFSIGIIAVFFAMWFNMGDLFHPTNILFFIVLGQCCLSHFLVIRMTKFELEYFLLNDAK